MHLISEIIRECLPGVIADVAVLMGANIANEVARDEFCESTLASASQEAALLWHAVFDRPSFQVACSSDVHGTELCGALKNIVALGAGMADGLGLGANTKAAIIRIGLLEMQHFALLHRQKSPADSAEAAICQRTLLESCGVADLITTCFGGRNRKVAEAFARTGKSLEVLEAELLNGQKLQGPDACKAAVQWIRTHRHQAAFPLFDAIYAICFEGLAPQQLLTRLMARPHETSRLTCKL